MTNDTCTCGFYYGPHEREIHRRAARKRNELYGNPGTHEGSVQAGLATAKAYPDLARENGRKAVENGTDFAALGRIGARKTNDTWGKTPEAKEIRTRVGRINGRKSVQSGQIYINQKGTPVAIDENLVAGSFDEATTYLVLREAGISHSIPEPIVLPDGSRYFPDLILFEPVGDVPVGVPLELKPANKRSPDGIFWRSERQREKIVATGVVVLPYSALWEDT